jgi:hypothetical protein
VLCRSCNRGGARRDARTTRLHDCRGARTPEPREAPGAPRLWGGTNAGCSGASHLTREDPGHPPTGQRRSCAPSLSAYAASSSVPACSELSTTRSGTSFSPAEGDPESVASPPSEGNPTAAPNGAPGGSGSEGGRSGRPSCVQGGSPAFRVEPPAREIVSSERTHPHRLSKTVFSGGYKYASVGLAEGRTHLLPGRGSLELGLISSA